MPLKHPMGVTLLHAWLEYLVDVDIVICSASITDYLLVANLASVSVRNWKQMGKQISEQTLETNFYKLNTWTYL